MDRSFWMGLNTVAGASHRHLRMLPVSPISSGVVPMRNNKTSALRSMVALLIGLAGVLCLVAEGRAEETKPPLAIQFTFDRPMEASMAPFAVAANRGLFGKEGLNVSTNS